MLRIEWEVLGCALVDSGSATCRARGAGAITRLCITACCCNIKGMSGYSNGTLLQFHNVAHNHGVMMYMLALCSHIAQSAKACVAPSVAQLFSSSSVPLYSATQYPLSHPLHQQQVRQEKQGAFAQCIATLLLQQRHALQQHTD